MKPFRTIVSLLLTLAMVCGMFSVLPAAAEEETPAVDLADGTYVPNRVVVLFNSGAIDTDTVPRKGDLAAVGAFYLGFIGLAVFFLFPPPEADVNMAIPELME